MSENTQVEAKVLVTKEIAEALPSRPDWMRECVTQAESSMNEIASERHRHVSARPEFTDARDTRLGYVELTFVAPTEAD